MGLCAFSSQIKSGCQTESNCKEYEEWTKMGEQKKLNIAMLGDGDIIGTTKKNHVESGLLAA